MDIPEGELVRLLLADRHWHKWILGIKGMPDSPRVLQAVRLRDVPGNFEGDADIVLIDPTRPGEVTAIEVKRIKVGASAFETGTPNKLHEYEKAVAQANRLGMVGFGQVYLFCVVVVDSRRKNDGRYTYDGMTPELREAVHSRLSLERLTPRVGLVVHEFVQSMDPPPLVLGTYGGSLLRAATPCAQPAGLTEWAVRLLARGAA